MLLVTGLTLLLVPKGESTQYYSFPVSISTDQLRNYHCIIGI